MKKILISCDSTCALPRDEAKKIGLPILPLNVIVDGVEYHDGIDIDPDQLNQMMRGGKSIKTSTPTPVEIDNFFDQIFKEEDPDVIIHFTISSKLSSMFNLFTNHCKERYGDKVVVVDSLSVCVYMLNHVLTAKKLAEEGKSVEEILSSFQNRVGTEDVTFIPETLTYLKRGGRISPAVATIGNLLNMKPVLGFINGAIEKKSTTRNLKSAIANIFQDYKKKNYDPAKYELGIIVFDTKESTLEIAKKCAEEVCPEFHYSFNTISINVCAHCGPGTIGIGMHKKIDA